MKSQLIVWLAQGFGVGRIRFAPGTWGSLVGILWALLLLWPGSLAFYLAGVIASSLVAAWVCGRAEEILGQHDPGSVVLDEIVAVPVAVGGYVGLWWWQADSLPSVANIGSWWPVLVAAFLLFRLFDIWKPWPIRALQKLPGGWGVVVDDLAAGVASAVVLALGCHAAFAIQLIRG
jgi:phosphatidylglycerophosphatase A